MRTEVSVMNLIAYCFYKWKSIVIMMVTLGILLGGYSTVSGVQKWSSSDNTAEKIDATNESMRAAYDERKVPMQAKLNIEQEALTKAEQYMDESMLMKLDPYNVYTVKLCYSIELSNDDDFNRTVEYDTTPESFMVGKIQSLYIAMWDIIDLTEVPEFQGLECSDRYLREIVRVWQRSGGLIEIRTWAESLDKAEMLAKTIGEVMESKTAEVQEISYEHNFSLMTQASLFGLDDYVLNAQTDQIAFMNEKREAIIKLEQGINEITKPSYVHIYTKSMLIKDAVKLAVIGMILGLMLALVVNIFVCIMYNRVVVSTEVVRYQGIPFIGAIQKRGNCFVKVATRLTGEKTWRDLGKAGEYIQGMSELYLPGKNVLIVTLQGVKGKSEEITELERVFQEKGYNTLTLTDGLTSSDLVKKIKLVDKVVLVVKSANDSLQSISDIKDLVELCGKSVGGFVII